MAFVRRDFAGGAVSTGITVVGDLGTGTTTITLSASTGWPAGTNGPFYVVIDKGNSNEEKALITSRSGTTLTVNARGVDGTSAATHTSGCPISHCHTAVDDDEANAAVFNTIGKVSAAEDLIVGSGLNAFKRLAKGTNGQLLQVVAGALAYGALPAGAVTAGVIGAGGISANTQFAAGVVDNAAISASAGIALSKLATQATLTLLGNNTGGTAVPTALTATQVKTLLAIVAANISDFDTQVRTSTLNQMTAPTADLSINTHKLTSVTDPTSAQDAATKAYVDARAPIASSTYAPVLRQAGGAIACTVTYAHYVRVGPNIVGNFVLTLTGNGNNAGDQIDVTLPIAHTIGADCVIGGIRWSDGTLATRVATLVGSAASPTFGVYDGSTLLQTPALRSGNTVSGAFNYMVA